MATMQNAYPVRSFSVVHPLRDVAETKCSAEGLGPIAITRAVRISLAMLRGYLLAMTLMLGYHVLELAGVLHRMR